MNGSAGDTRRSSGCSRHRPGLRDLKRVCLPVSDSSFPDGLSEAARHFKVGSWGDLRGSSHLLMIRAPDCTCLCVRAWCGRGSTGLIGDVQGVVEDVDGEFDVVVAGYERWRQE